MLKLKLVLSVVLLSISGFAIAASKSTELESEVLESFQSLVSASKNLDAESYFEHFDADKFVGLNSDGTNWNSMDELVPLIKFGFNSIREVTSLEFTNVKVSVIDDYTAILVNEFSQSMVLVNGDTINVSGGGTQVWSKRNGRWKLVSVSASNKPSASTP
ncbi:nuclear transport factor 2 family protein [Alteromonas sp. KUL49]|uniref:YybH family protein n=1 Tax=Alteromonas sp. KUL49 TaxID=2480798 RepID=UPI0010FFC74F|nr:nuclear transport factor 2 family protein [Alteromonas sp. KUL49]GEA10251.1 hypothetical protein KUL49_06260 [Alteromonas sp. KUL49]